ncbi:unnamed protein product [Macrosiphum euphorbiae]|uniref:Uncharacterized protein n=1 Tax=Macrosiphum euphorbiae TaxID=13131 RepID=A0AAV0XKC9_9HEMI|nr:unnamed protein product [Macrosiphum euphorbiae]
MSYALKKKITASSNETKRKDWLEYADDKYNTHKISELRSALDVMYLLIPVPLFYTLFDQQGSRWTLQGTLMNGKIEFLNWSIKPDQIHLINPLFVLIFIPLFNGVVYPILYKIGINTPLKKVTLGGIFAASSFVCSAVVQHIIIGHPLLLPSNEGQLRIYNNFDCRVAMSGSLVSSYLLTSKNNDEIELKNLNELRKLRSGNSNLRISYSDNLSGKSITLRNTNNKLSDINNFQAVLLNKNTNHEIPVGTYDIYLDNEHILKKIDLLPASVNELIFHQRFNQTNAKLITLENGKYIHILWQVPQTLLITVAEVMIIVTLLEFTFTQAPLSMKSFISAANLCTQAVGNLLIVIISKMKLFENQVHEYIFYVILVVLGVIIFMLMSAKYKYKSVTDNQSQNER